MLEPAPEPSGRLPTASSRPRPRPKNCLLDGVVERRRDSPTVRIRTSGWSVVVVVVAAVIVGAAGAREDGPPAGQIAFVRFSAASAHPRIVALRLAGGAPRPLPLRVAAAGAPAWSPNGRELVFVGGVNAVGSSDLTGSTYLYVWRAGRSRLRPLTPRGSRVGSASWSPDGARIAYSLSAVTGNRFSLWVVGAGGGGARRLTAGAIDLEPSWSPNGRLIAFVRVDPASYQSGVWLVRPDGGGLRMLRVGITNATEPVWSPGSARLLVEDGRAIYSVRPDGGGVRKVVSLSADAQGAVEDPQPAWSPDGRWIVFCQFRAGVVGRSDLWLVRPDGTGLRQLTRSPELDRDPSWGS